MDISAQFREARRQQGLSQGVLGERLGISQAHLSDVEKGKVSPRLSSAMEIARALDHELILVPRKMLPAIKALLSGKSDAPLWQVDEKIEDSEA